MTKDEAKIILEKLEEIPTITDGNGVTWFYQISDLYHEYSDCFFFAVYSYSSKKPLDPKSIGNPPALPGDSKSLTFQGL
jgi:hypothetical protein